jgi:hypothetical protein
MLVMYGDVKPSARLQDSLQLQQPSICKIIDVTENRPTVD